MSNAGNFNNGPPTALMSYPFPMHNPPQHPPLMEQTYMNPISQHFQPYPPPTYNIRPTMQTPKSEKRKQEILTCDVCGIEVNSQQMMDAHLQGQKHIKKMKLKVVSTATPPTTQPLESTDINQEPPLPEVASSNATIEATAPSIEQNPVPSATVAKATSSNERSVLQSINEMAKFNKVNAKYDLIKETGPAHCKQFEVRLSLGEETYAGTGTSIKRAQQDAAEKALTATVLKKPESTPRGSHSTRAVRGSAAGGGGGGTNRGMYSNVRPSYPIQTNRQKSYSSTVGQQNENLFLNLINNKCSEITENENTIRILHQLVEDIERALKTVSDKIMEQSKQNNISVVPQLPDNVKLNNIEQPNDDPTESFRMLKGAMKVSKLAMRLFYKYDYEYSLVLICANKPTITLLNDICQELSIGLNAQAIAALQLESNNEQSTPITYQIEKYINDACLTVQCSRLPKHIIRIMLTSPVFRSENFLNLDEQTREQISELNPDPSDMLDKNKCLEAAAEIRHSNWFTRCMSENPSNLNILHLLRDLQYHQTPLSSLNLWCIILLVYQCQNRSINSSLNLFRSVFSCLSSGILLPNYIGPGIIDPCEKEVVDASAYLTTKQRLDITKYAHDTLRLIAFEKYEDIFQFETNPNPNSNEQLLINSTTATYLME